MSTFRAKGQSVPYWEKNAVASCSVKKSEQSSERANKWKKNPGFYNCSLMLYHCAISSLPFRYWEKLQLVHTKTSAVIQEHAHRCSLQNKAFGKTRYLRTSPPTSSMDFTPFTKLLGSLSYTAPPRFIFSANKTVNRQWLGEKRCSQWPGVVSPCHYYYYPRRGPRHLRAIPRSFAERRTAVRSIAAPPPRRDLRTI